MKTNQIMVRNNQAFIQRTKDGYFNATNLLDVWNMNSSLRPLQMGRYKILKSTIEFVEQLKKEGIEFPLIAGRGRYAGTWMHPKLIIDFAMWVSVEFKSIVIDYVLDGLITSRHDAGDYYKQMTAAIISSHYEFYGTKPNPGLYQIEARRIKQLLCLEDKDRNIMTEKELNSITMLQKLNSLLLKRRIGKNSRIRQLKLQAELLTM